MEKQQSKSLAKQWQKATGLIEDIEALARSNPILAYGVIRTAETLVDFEMVSRMHQIAKDNAKAASQPKEGV